MVLKKVMNKTNLFSGLLTLECLRKDENPTAHLQLHKPWLIRTSFSFLSVGKLGKQAWFWFLVTKQDTLISYLNMIFLNIKCFLIVVTIFCGHSCNFFQRIGLHALSSIMTHTESKTVSRSWDFLQDKFIFLLEHSDILRILTWIGKYYHSLAAAALSAALRALRRSWAGVFLRPGRWWRWLWCRCTGAGARPSYTRRPTVATPWWHSTLSCATFPAAQRFLNFDTKLRNSLSLVV